MTDDEAFDIMYNETPTEARFGLLQTIFSLRLEKPEDIRNVTTPEVWPVFKKILDRPNISSRFIQQWPGCMAALSYEKEGWPCPRPTAMDIGRLCSALSLPATDSSKYYAAVSQWPGDSTAEMREIEERQAEEEREMDDDE